VSRFSLSRGISAFRRPARRAEPDELRIDLEQKLTNCDALIVVYGAQRVSDLGEKPTRSG
jgi:hypothetical protein